MRLIHTVPPRPPSKAGEWAHTKGRRGGAGEGAVEVVQARRGCAACGRACAALQPC